MNHTCSVCVWGGAFQTVLRFLSGSCTATGSLMQLGMRGGPLEILEA